MQIGNDNKFDRLVRGFLRGYPNVEAYELFRFDYRITGEAGEVDTMVMALETFETGVFQEVFADESSRCHDIDSCGCGELFAHCHCHFNGCESEEVGLSRIEE